MDYEKLMTDLEEKVNKSIELNKELRLARIETYRHIRELIEFGESDKAINILTEMIEFYENQDERDQ